ncbi:MAG: type II toxin-antitoxin system RelE/ParE family toxin [candidate division WOR-3 bacterium]
MEVKFRNPKLLELYQKGKSKKYVLGSEVVKKFSLRIEILQAAVNIYDLWKSPSLHFEKMTGYDKRYSVRIDKKHRLEFEIEWTDDKKTVGVVKIIEISKHYE